MRKILILLFISLFISCQTIENKNKNPNIVLIVAEVFSLTQRRQIKYVFAIYSNLLLDLYNCNDNYCLIMSPHLHMQPPPFGKHIQLIFSNSEHTA